MAFPEAADLAPAETDLGKAHVVRFLNCTSNKPLHLGHLRNVALGEALVGSLRALGAQAVKHCVLEDTGRFMTEAMVAIAEAEASGLVLPEPGPGTDHFVGACYAGYRKARAERAVSSANRDGGEAPAASVNYDGTNEDADTLMRRLLAKNKAALLLRDRVRRLALAGQEATLARLGVTFDYCDFESAEDEWIRQFVTTCRRHGPLKKNAKGQLVWTAAGGGELRLVGKNGLAEESARLISLNARIARTKAASHMVIVFAGSEWKRSMMLYAEFLSRLGIDVHQTYAPTFYGMVTLKGKKMASSEGTGVLVDGLVDRLAGDQRLQSLATQSGVVVSADALAGSVIRAFLLSTARTEAIEYSDDLVSLRLQSGWNIVPGGRLRQRNFQEPFQSRAAASARWISRRSFELEVGRTAQLGDRIAAGRSRRADKIDFGCLAQALSLVPKRSSVDFAGLPSFLTAGAAA